MNLNKLPAKAKNDCYNVIIEIPQNANAPVKYEFNKDAQIIEVDRVLPVAMFYPCNYGFIPHTLSGDGDPADVLVMSQYPIISGAVVRARPVAVLIMEDESGIDEKILAVPDIKIDPSFSNVQDLEDIAESVKDRIVHFFESYKRLEKNKWVKIVGWDKKAKAIELIEQAIVNNVD